MRIQDALSQIRTIQTQLDRTQRCCCYRWATVAASGLFAALAAVTQSIHLPHPMLDLREYLTLWITIAALSVAVVAVEVLVQWRHTQSRYASRQTVAAIRQFAPSLAAGALVTWAIFETGPEHAALLPGLWATFFSLGIFASAAYLPRGGAAVGAYYLVAGLICILWGQGDQALQPWTMVITFSVGQCMAALVMYRRHEERREDTSE
jgi:hypothetical protein